MVSGESQRRLFPGDEELNESCTVSFDVEGHASFHFSPQTPPGRDMKLVRMEMRNYFLGLQELASRIDDAHTGKNLDERYKKVAYIAFTSWIGSENESILTRSGFTEDTSMSPHEKEVFMRAYTARRDSEVLPDHRDISPKIFRVSVGDFILDIAPWRRWANRAK